MRMCGRYIEREEALEVKSAELSQAPHARRRWRSANGFPCPGGAWRQRPKPAGH